MIKLYQKTITAFLYGKAHSLHCAKKKLRCLQELPLTGILLFTKVFFLMNGRYWDSVTPTLSIRSDTNELLDVCISRDSNVAQVH